MMLEHMGELDAARKIEQAVRDVVREGTHVTPDLKPGSAVGTQAMADELVRRVSA